MPGVTEARDSERVKHVLKLMPYDAILIVAPMRVASTLQMHRTGYGPFVDVAKRERVLLKTEIGILPVVPIFDAKIREARETGRIQETSSQSSSKPNVFT